jgi:prevent-host-death family protein
MMVVYTYSEARQNLSTVLDKAAQEGEVRVKRKNGQVFVIRPVAPGDSPLDVDGVDLGLTTEEILEFIQEGRRLS